EVKWVSCFSTPRPRTGIDQRFGDPERRSARAKERLSGIQHAAVSTTSVVTGMLPSNSRLPVSAATVTASTVPSLRMLAKTTCLPSREIPGELTAILSESRVADPPGSGSLNTYEGPPAACPQ